jgi:pyruvate/2-oxoglutarate dehydrogenase complex dihydrolipoamide acyltransferase (E2) component
MRTEVTFNPPPTAETSIVTAILKSSGDSIAAGEAMIEVETDKAMTVIESPYDGTILDIEVEPGDELVLGDVLATVETAT